MDTERMLKPALIGGILLGILSTLLPFINCICCAGIISGGILAAYLLVKDSPLSVSMGSGVVVGLFAGIIGAIVKTIFSIPLYYLLMNLASPEQFLQWLTQTFNLPPQTQQTVEAALDVGNIGLIDILFSLFFSLVPFCLFAMLGGAIGVAVFEKRKPGDTTHNQPSYQPPADEPPSDTPPADTPQEPPDE